jgi:hypothetical protein
MQQKLKKNQRNSFENTHKHTHSTLSFVLIIVLIKLREKNHRNIMNIGMCL